jgi:hypothetical protein
VAAHSFGAAVRHVCRTDPGRATGTAPLRGGAGLPRWLGFVAAVALAEQLVETITIFGRHGFIAPGGAMNVDLGAGLVGVALLCLGVAVARTSMAGIRTRALPER